MKLTTLHKTSIIAFVAFVIYTCNIYFDYKKDLTAPRYRNLLTTFDSVSNTFLPYNLLTYGSLDFSNSHKVIVANIQDDYFFLENYKGQAVSVYPIIPGLAALPFYVIPVIANWIPDLNSQANILKVLVLGRLSASFIAAVSVGLVYLVLAKFQKNEKLAILFATFYAFGTTTWAISSRVLWQHTTSQLILAALIYVLLFTKKHLLVGILAGLLVLNRPLLVVVVGFLALYYLLYKRAEFGKFIAGGLPSAILLLIYNTLMFGGPFIEGYGARNDFNWGTPLIESLTGFAFSPARSLLVISPLLLLFIPSLIQLVKTKKCPELVMLGLGSVAYLLVMCKWYTWDGANGFGYRMLTDLLPLWVTLAFIRASDWKNQKVYILMVVLVAYSASIQANAVFNLKSRCDHEDNWTVKCLPLKMPTQTN